MLLFVLSVGLIPNTYNFWIASNLLCRNSNSLRNSSKFKFVHQSWTHLYTPKNMNFWDHNLGLTQQSQFYLMYSVTHMDSYRSKLVFWPLFKGLETCPSRFVMGSTVHFIFWNNVQTKWIFEFWPYFQKIPMWKHKKLENWRSKNQGS